MPPRLPSVLSAADLPVAELYAARLDGDLYAVGGAFSPMDEIEGPENRAAAVHAGAPERLIAERLSAAWVWGALDSPPARRQFCVATGSRVSHSPARWLTVREVVIGADEITDLGGRAVTSPLRTAVDLLRSSERFGAEDEVVVRRLLGGAGLRQSTVATAIQSRRNLPDKRRALTRLVRCSPPDQPLLTR